MSIISKCHSSRMALSAFPFCRICLYGITSLVIIIVLWMAMKKDNLKLYRNLSANSTSKRNVSGYVTMQGFRGRLGNQMFMFIALFYVALKTNREVVLFDGHNGHELEKYFNLGVRKIKRSCPCLSFHENSPAYDNRIEKIITSENATNIQTILLQGYFQSLNYIEPVEHLVLSHLKFQLNIEIFARNNLRETIPKGWTEGQFTRVGIHNRRGDLVSSKGVATAPASYFEKAMKYFADRYKFVQFLVASDDMGWSRQHIKYDSQSSSVKVTYSEEHSPGQDMAILSLCDHVIISIGTFGWMSAWLANGTTIYYSKFLRNGSTVLMGLNRLDYFPPHWIAME